MLVPQVTTPSAGRGHNCQRAQDGAKYKDDRSVHNIFLYKFNVADHNFTNLIQIDPAFTTHTRILHFPCNKPQQLTYVVLESNLTQTCVYLANPYMLQYRVGAHIFSQGTLRHKFTLTYLLQVEMVDIEEGLLLAHSDALDKLSTPSKP